MFPSNYTDKTSYHSFADVIAALPAERIRSIHQEAKLSQRWTPILLGFLLVGLGMAGAPLAAGLLRREVVVLSASGRMGVFAGAGGAVSLGCLLARRGYVNNHTRFERIYEERVIQVLRGCLVNLAEKQYVGCVCYTPRGYYLIQTDKGEEREPLFYPYSAQSKHMPPRERAFVHYSGSIALNSVNTDKPRHLVSLEELKTGF